MPAELTNQDLNTLQNLADSGNREGYWTYLKNKGDNYANLALGVVTNETLFGYIANEHFTKAFKDTHAGRTPTTQELWNVGLGIMRADLQARRNANTDPAYYGSSSNLNVQAIRDYHEIVFEDFNVPATGWTFERVYQDTLIEGLAYTNSMWQEMLDEGSAAGLVSKPWGTLQAMLTVMGSYFDWNPVKSTGFFDNDFGVLAQWTMSTFSYMNQATDVSLRNINNIEGWYYTKDGWFRPVQLPNDMGIEYENANEEQTVYLNKQREFRLSHYQSVNDYSCLIGEYKVTDFNNGILTLEINNNQSTSFVTFDTTSTNGLRLITEDFDSGLTIQERYDLSGGYSTQESIDGKPFYILNTDGKGYSFEKTFSNEAEISTEKFPDGKIIEISTSDSHISTTTINPDGSYQTHDDDLHGNINKASYRSDGTIAHSESIKADGTTTVTDYQKNGVSDTVVTNPDGTKVIIRDDGQNNINSTYLNQDGSIDYIQWNEGNTLGYEEHTLDPNTNITTKEGIIKYGNGEKTEYTNTDDGINETKESTTYSATGELKSAYSYKTSIEKTTNYQPDGSFTSKQTNLLNNEYQTVQSDGKGNNVIIDYNAYNIEKKREWTLADGTKGEAPDGGFSIINQDAQDNIILDIYTSNGIKLRKKQNLYNEVVYE